MKTRPLVYERFGGRQTDSLSATIGIDRSIFATSDENNHVT
jgi:hypothetical protein